MYEKRFKMMELYIETLTGSVFELRVSPHETVQDVKARIQKLEGIPVSQQHLIWQTIELDDDYRLSHYSIQDGATLKLVLTMRGGPINTRRISVEDPTLREMAEYYSEASREDLLDKMPGGNRPVTVIVYHNGNELNFFRLVDRESTSPLSESISGASMCNIYDEEEEDEYPLKEQTEENDKMKEKMKDLRSKMENLTLNKKPKRKLIPRPPSTSRPGSQVRLRRMPSTTGTPFNLNKNYCLPPVRQSTASGSGPDVDSSGTSNVATASVDASIYRSPPSSGSLRRKTLERLEACEGATMKCALSSVKEDVMTSSRNAEAPADKEEEDSLETILRKAHVTTWSPRLSDFSSEVLLQDGSLQGSPPSQKKHSDVTIDSVKELHRTPTSHRLEKLLETDSSSGPGRPAPKDRSMESSFRDSFGKTASASRYGSSDRRSSRGGVILESLNPREVRAMSGMLSSLVRSASRSRAGFPLSSAGLKEVGRIPTPEVRHVSGRVRFSDTRDGRGVTPTHHLPPVKAKKKKRCFVCGKKTGLATTYKCRCGNSFCASHRYAEAHDCTFDYKEEGRKILEQSNPVVTAPKLPKI